MNKSFFLTVLVSTFLVFQLNGQCFDPAVNYPAGNNPRYVCSDDFNNDGHLDLAIANAYNVNYISILLGSGTGTFAAPVNYYVGNQPWAIITTDFNGDNEADLAVLHQAYGMGSTSVVSILLGSGTGSFGAPIYHQAGVYPTSLATNDFNGDNEADLIITNRDSDSLTLLLGNGNGTFTTSPYYLAIYPGGGSQPYAVATGDYNGDNYADLAVADYINGINILLGNGNGTFGGVSDYQFIGSASEPFLLSEDVNGDNLPDLVVTEEYHDRIAIFFGTPWGSFDPPVKFFVGDYPTTVATSDFNSDGIIDLVVANGNSDNISVLQGTGSGNFAAAVNYSVGIDPGHVITGDFNGDGLPDIVVTNLGSHNVSVILNNPSSYLYSTINPVACNRYTSPSGNYTWTLSGSYQDTVINNTSCDSVYTVNLTIYYNNTSSTINPTACGSYTSPSGNYTWTSNGTYNDTIPNLGGCDSLITINLTIKNNSASVINTTACGSYTSPSGNYTWTTSGTYMDTIPNSIACDSVITINLTITAGSGTVTFDAAVNYSTGDGPRAVCTSDFNGDGFVDLAVTNIFVNKLRIFLGSNTGTFTAAGDYTTGGMPWSVTTSDFNGDGFADLVLTHLSYNKVRLFLGSGNGTFSFTGDYSAGSALRSIAAADFNGDGDIDMAVADASSNRASILMGNGNGTFAVPVYYTVGTNPNSVTTSDFNGDGFADLALSNRDTDNVSILMGNGNGSFASAVNFSIGDGPHSVISTDFNGDGFADIATANRNSDNISILLGSGTGSFASAVNYPVGNEPITITTADFNSDGLSDVVTANYVSNNISLLLGSGNGTFATAINYLAGTAPNDVNTDDFNNDGVVDIVVANRNSDNISILFNTTPQVNLGADTTVCSGTAIVLDAGIQFGWSYLWSTGATTQTINVSTSGNYWVNVTNGCNSISDTINVTITGPTVVYNETQTVLNDNDAPVTLTAGSPLGGTYIGTAVSGNVFDPANAGAGTYDIIYTYTDGNSCSNSDTSTIIVITPSSNITWTGAVSSNWFTPGNWSGGVVPTSTDDALILDVANAPQINGLTTAQVKGLTVDTGATVFISITSELQLFGDLSNAGIFNGTGHLSFKGGTQNIIGSTTFSGIVSVPTGNTLNTNSNLTIAKGGVLLHGIGTTQGGGTISGDVTVQQVGHANGSSNFWSSPVSGTNVSFLGRHIHYYDPNAASGTTAAGLRDGWIAATGNMIVGVGYTSRRGGSGLVSFTGTAGNANTGSPINISVTKNAGTGVAWNLIGNPFPSGLKAADFMAVNGPSGTGGVLGSIYLWDDDGSGGSGYAQADFAAWSGAGSVNGPNSGITFNGVVGVGQSFFVEKIANGTSNIEFRNNMRSATNDVFFRQQAIERFWISTTNPVGLYNEILIAFIDDATDGYDALYDAKKLRGNEDIALYSKINGDDYAIQALEELNTDKEIVIGLQTTVSGTQTLELNRFENLDETMSIVLEDRQEGIFQSLNVDPIYTFTATAGVIENRFYIHVSAAIIIESLPTSCTSNSDGQFTLQQNGNKTWDYILTDAQGMQVDAAQSFNGIVNIDNLPNGIYTLTLTDSYGYQVVKTLEVEQKEKVSVSFIASQTEVTVAEAIEFIQTITGATSYTWNFGDGTIIANQSNPQHSYVIEGSYVVSLSAENTDCNNLVTQVINVEKQATSISTDDDGSIRVYSNSMTVYIAFENISHEEVSISIFDASGKQGYQNQIAVNKIITINLGNLAEGFYLVKLETPSGVSSAKVILNR